MAITRKRKSCPDTTVEAGKRIHSKRSSELPTPPASPPQTPQHSQRRIRIHLRTPSAPKRIRLRLSPYPRLSIPFGFPEKPEDTPEVVFRMYTSYLSTSQISYPGSLNIPVDINAFMELYFLAERFGDETLRWRVLERVERCEWSGVVVRESVVKCFEKLGGGDGLRGWMVGRLVEAWTGGASVRIGKGGEDEEGKEEVWGWVTEEMREDVLAALRRGDWGFGEVEVKRTKVEC